jgi:hypothetical protein
MFQLGKYSKSLRTILDAKKVIMGDDGKEN